MQHLAVGMLGGFEGQARGTVQLADDHALGAIDNKGALGSHEGQFAHEHLFFFGALFLLEEESDIERRAVGQAFAQTFEPIHFRLADFVGMEIEHAFAVVTFDREDLGENGLEPEILAAGLGHLRLEEFPVRIGLQLDQVGRGNDLFDFAEVNSFNGSRWHLDL